MHERALMDDFMRKVRAVAKEQNATRVTTVRVRVGELSHMTPDHFREHFEDVSRGTLAEGARVEVEMIPGITHAHARELLLDSIDVEA